MRHLDHLGVQGQQDRNVARQNYHHSGGVQRSFSTATRSCIVEEGLEIVLDDNALMMASGGAEVLLDGNVLAQSKAAAKLYSTDAMVNGKAKATVKGSSEATSRRWVGKTSPAGVEATAHGEAQQLAAPTID